MTVYSEIESNDILPNNYLVLLLDIINATKKQEIIIIIN